MCDEITNSSFTNFNGCTADVREWISNFILAHPFTGHVITLLYWDMTEVPDIVNNVGLCPKNNTEFVIMKHSS